MPLQDRLEPFDTVLRLAGARQLVPFAGEPQHLRWNAVDLEHTEQLLTLLDRAPEVGLGMQHEGRRGDPVGVAQGRCLPQLIRRRVAPHVQAVEVGADVGRSDERVPHIQAPLGDRRAAPACAPG